jgi:hypothetical protein
MLLIEEGFLSIELFFDVITYNIFNGDGNQSSSDPFQELILVWLTCMIPLVHY